MSKRSYFTTITPLPTAITRETVMETLRSHTEMIDLNPLVEERHPIKAPSTSSPEEYHCMWYSLTDRIDYLPGGKLGMSGKVSYNACFHDLHNGLQTHVYAPMGLNIRGKWTLGGSLPGEPIAPVELGLGVPRTGLYLREDVDMKCNIIMTSFVKKTLKKSHAHLVQMLLKKAHAAEAENKRQTFMGDSVTVNEEPSVFRKSKASAEYSPSNCDPQSAVSAQMPQSELSTPQIDAHTEYLPHRTQTPPLDQHPAFREQGRDGEDSLYPAALQTSSGSYNISMVSHSRHASNQEPVRSHSNERTSWQQQENSRAGFHGSEYPNGHAKSSSIRPSLSAGWAPQIPAGAQRNTMLPGGNDGLLRTERERMGNQTYQNPVRQQQSFVAELE